MRASATRNVHAILAPTAFRAACQAATSAANLFEQSIRRFRHGPLRTLNSHSAMFSHEASLGV